MGRSLVSLIVVAICSIHAVTPAAGQQVPQEGWVVLPVDEYHALRSRLRPPLPLPLSPLEATLTRVEYQLRVEGDTVIGQAALSIDVLRDGWTAVRIPAGLLARGARIDGEPVSLVEGPPPYVLLARAGRAILTLDLVAPLSSSAGSESLTLPASASSITNVTLAIPRMGVDLSVNGGFIAERAEAPDVSRWMVYGRPNQRLVLSWKRRVDDRRAEQPLRMRARVTEVVGLADDAAQVHASVRLEVLQGLAREVTLALPAGLVVNKVDGATVGDWEPGPGVLRVRFLDPVTAESSFVVQGESPAPRDGTVEVPLLRVPAAERETGGVAVDVVGAGEVVGRQVRGLDPADPVELGDEVASRESPSMTAFRLRPAAGSEARSLLVDVVRYTPQAVLVANIEEARYRALVSEDGRVLVEARYAVRNNQRSFLKVTLPPGSRIWSASVAGRPTRPGVAEGTAVLVPLEKGRAGVEAPTFLVTVLYFQAVAAWPNQGRARLELPAVDLPISRTGLSIHHSPRFQATPQPGAFRVDVDPGPSAEAFRRPPPVASPAAARPVATLEEGATSGLQLLIDRFRNEPGGRTVVGALPVSVPFPPLGPSVFLASELTAEGRTSAVELVVKRTK